MKLKMLSPLVVLFTLLAGWAAAAAGPGEPGSASGTFTIDGKAVALRHAYAMRQPNTFDEKKNDTAILLTENPLPDKKLEGLKDLESASWEKGSSLLLTLDDTGRAIREVVHHSALGEKSLQMSGMTNSEVRIGSQTKDAIAGSAATPKEGDFLGHRYSSDVTFNAPIRDAFREPPPPDAKTGQKLPPGGGEPGKAWRAVHDAILRRDLPALKKMSRPGELPDLPDDELKKGLELMALMSPEKIVIEEGYVSGDEAVLYMTGMQAGEKQYGSVRMTRMGGAWRPAGEKWSNKKP